MAKKSAAKKGKASRESAGSATLNAAAVRWFALRIEARALELILTDPKAQTLVIDILKTAKRKLNRIKAERDFEFASCTPPWKRCADNVCRPDCDEDERLPDEPLPMEFESLGRGRNRPVG